MRRVLGYARHDCSHSRLQILYLLFQLYDDRVLCREEFLELHAIDIRRGRCFDDLRTLAFLRDPHKFGVDGLEDVEFTESVALLFHGTRKVFVLSAVLARTLINLPYCLS